MEGKPWETRVREMVATLCEEGYMAEYSKKDPKTFIITERNCAIARIAHQYQQACHGEMCLLSELLGAEV